MLPVGKSQPAGDPFDLPVPGEKEAGPVAVKTEGSVLRRLRESGEKITGPGPRIGERGVGHIGNAVFFHAPIIAAPRYKMQQKNARVPRSLPDGAPEAI